jgi:hypothetical protein
MTIFEISGVTDGEPEALGRVGTSTSPRCSWGSSHIGDKSLSISKRLRRAVVGVAALAVLGTTASAALADSPWDDPANNPNTTNVPYLAWRGENLRLVKCWGTDDFNRAYRQQNASVSADIISDNDVSNLFGSIVQTNVQLEDWSGEDTGVNTPKEVINGARTFLYYNVRTLRPVICWQDTWASNKAGLGQFKLTVSLGLTNILSTGVSLGAQVLVMQHQWLAGWMSLQAPTLDEVGSIDPTKNPEGLADPKGDGNVFAGDHWVQGSDGKWYWDGKNTHPAEIRATVKGTLPLGQDYSELGLGASITLPDQWADLAAVLATDANYTNANPKMRWDIHDEMVDTFGNTTTGTGGRNNNATDKVVNAGWPFNWPVTSNGDASFTRVLASSIPFSIPSDFPTAGPFDPNFAEQTLLPDGVLNAGDAPMPAARIDFNIAPNTDPLHSTDGVGSFVSASKAHDYSMDYTGSNKKGGNLFAPFYSQYIPATSRDVFGYASGVDGALITNNFPGFLAWGKVQDWTSIPLGSLTAGYTKCNQRDGHLRSTPGGVQSTAVYTDEHGEARVNFLPGGQYGDDFWFDALNKTPGDSNGGCDLKGQKILGTAHISAIARYPYQKVTDPDKPAKSGLVKTVYNLFDKHLSYYPKNYNYSSDNAELAKVVVAHAQDINGQPFVNEVVCFSGQYEGSGAAIQGGLPPVGPFTVNRPDGTQFTVYSNPQVPSPRSNGWLCTTTDDGGNAVFEETGSVKLHIDLMAYFASEGLFRHIDIDATSGSTSADNPPLTPAAVLAGGSATTGPGSNGTDAPTAAQVDQVVKAAIAGGFGVVAAPATGATITPVQTITPTKTITPVKVAMKTRVLSMRLVRPAHAKAYIMVKVQSAHKTAKIVIALKGKHNKTIAKITKTIATNKQVKIRSSSIKLAVKKVSLTSVK